MASQLARRTPRAELWHTWLQLGRRTPELPWLLVLIVVVTTCALVPWQQLFDGRPPQAYVDAAAGRPLWLLIIAGVGFSPVNALVEEAVFRGALQTALQQVAGPVVAVVVQAVAFGTRHVLGVPVGIVGAVMAGSWGLLLGLLRWRTRGLLAPPVRRSRSCRRHDLLPAAARGALTAATDGAGIKACGAWAARRVPLTELDVALLPRHSRREPLSNSACGHRELPSNK